MCCAVIEIVGKVSQPGDKSLWIFQVLITITTNFWLINHTRQKRILYAVLADVYFEYLVSGRVSPVFFIVTTHKGCCKLTVNGRRL